MSAHVEKHDKVLEFLALAATIEAHRTRIKQRADQSDTEEVVRHVDCTGVLR